MEHLTGHHLPPIHEDGVLPEETELGERLERHGMPREAKGLVLQGIEGSLEGPGCGGKAARGDECLELAQGFRELQDLVPVKARNLGDLPVPKKDGIAVIFVGEAVDVEGERVVPGKPGGLGKSAVPDADLDGTIHLCHCIRCQGDVHPRSHAAVRNDGYPRLLCSAIERELLSDDPGVPPEVGHVRPGREGQLGEVEIVCIRYGTQERGRFLQETLHGVTISDVRLHPFGLPSS